MIVASDDELWLAVGDPTRRRILDMLLTEEVGTPTSLSDRLPITRQAVAKHLSVLERAGLVHATPRGRERCYEIDDEQFARAVRQLTEVGRAWDGRLNRIKRMAEQIQRQRRD